MGIAQFSQPSTLIGDVVLSGSNADSVESPALGNVLYNGALWDRQRGNMEGIILASAARTANTIGPSVTNYNARGVILLLKVSAVSGTGGLKVTITSRDPIGFVDQIQLNTTPAAITAVGIYGYEFYPGSNSEGAVGNFLVQQRTACLLPRTWRAVVNHTDASSYTYSLGFASIL